jgi:hypothetical protein
MNMERYWLRRNKKVINSYLSNQDFMGLIERMKELKSDESLDELEAKLAVARRLHAKMNQNTSKAG